MIARIVIPGRLPGLNEYTKACRANKFAGAKMKAETEESICWQIKSQLKDMSFERVTLCFKWYEKDKKRDFDNICFARKFCLDSLQKMNIISGDGWKHVKGFSDEFYVDNLNPRVEIYIEEVD